MSTFQTESTTIPIQQTNIKENLYSNTKFLHKRACKYILAVIFVILMTMVIVELTKPSSNNHITTNNKPQSNQPPVQFDDYESQNNDKDDIVIKPEVETVALSSNNDNNIQDALNNELSKYFNPTSAKLDTDLVSIEFQYYFHPQQTSRESIISTIKNVIPYKCGADEDDEIIVVEARNTYIGGDIKSLRQRKNLVATKDKKVGLYDRTAKVLVYDINNFEERGEDGIPLTKSKHKQSNVVEEDKIKYEINRVIQTIDDGIQIQDILGYSSTVEFNSDQEFVSINNQDDVNEYFDNVYSILPSDFETATTYLSWTEFDCDLGGDIGEIEIDVQICYETKQDALNGDGDLDPNCANKINYKIDKDAGYWAEYLQLQDEFSRILPFVN